MRNQSTKHLEEAYEQVAEMGTDMGPRPEVMSPEEIENMDPAIASRINFDLKTLGRLSDEQLQAFRILASKRSYFNTDKKPGITFGGKPWNP